METMKNTVGNAPSSYISPALLSSVGQVAGAIDGTKIMTSNIHIPSAIRKGVVAMNISDLQTLCGERAKKSGWHADRPRLEQYEDLNHGHNFDMHRKALLNWQMTKLMMIVGEVAEGSEEIRNGQVASDTYYAGGELVQKYVDGVPTLKPEGLPSELADTVIRVLDFCFTEGIDLQEMIQEKLDFNQTRGRMHGGKAV